MFISGMARRTGDDRDTAHCDVLVFGRTGAARHEEELMHIQRTGHDRLGAADAVGAAAKYGRKR
jgi:hypothetical protein